MIMPWDVVGKATSYEYLHKSCYFPESAGYVDPKMMHHRTGLSFAVKQERDEIRKGTEKLGVGQ